MKSDKRQKGLRPWSALCWAAMPTLGGVTAFLGVIFAVLTYFVTLDVKAPVVWVFVSAFVPFSFCIMFLHMISMAQEDGLAAYSEIVPRVLRCFPRPGSEDLMLLVEASGLLGQGVLVSIYITENEFEILLGEGFVQLGPKPNKVLAESTIH